jgi:predicted alpha/beta hydrolase
MGVCAWCLARAHARTGDETGISGYIGKNDDFAQAIGDFAVAYADQTERDYQALVEAVKSGRITAETGI